MIEPLSNAERIRRERTSRLVTWLHRQFGFMPALCPSHAAVAQALGIRCKATAREALRRAELAGVIRIAKVERRHMVQVLPGWRDQPVPPMPTKLAAPAPRRNAVPRAREAKRVASPIRPTPQPEGAAGPSGTSGAGEGGSRPPPQAAPGGFGEWLQTAAPGARFVYFRGHLAAARGLAREERAPDVALALQDALEASGAAAAGQVLLFTRRQGEHMEYLAIRCRAAPRSS